MGLTKQDATRLQAFLVGRIRDGSEEAIEVAMQAFGLSRRAVRLHLEKLVQGGRLVGRGSARKRRYDIPPFLLERRTWSPGDEGARLCLWHDWLQPLLSDLAPAALDDLWLASEELADNVEAHAGATHAEWCLIRSAACVELRLEDDGVGLFEQLRAQRGLKDARAAALGLTEGAHGGLAGLTRVLDRLQVRANGLRLDWHGATRSWRVQQLEPDTAARPGTSVSAILFDELSHPIQLAFDPPAASLPPASTWIPVDFALREARPELGEAEARALLELAALVPGPVVDFRGVEEISEAFADLLFGAALATRGSAPKLRRARASVAVEESIRASALRALQRR